MIRDIALSPPDDMGWDNVMSGILALDDEDILTDDTLFLALSEAYSGLNRSGLEHITQKGGDLDMIRDDEVAVLLNGGDHKVVFLTFPDTSDSISLNLSAGPYNLGVNPSEDRIAVALADGSVRIINLLDGKELDSLQLHHRDARDVLWLDNHRIVSVGNDRRVVCWDLQRGDSLWNRRVHEKNIKSIRKSSDAKYLVTTSNDGTAAVLDTDGNTVYRYSQSDNYVNSAAISPDNSFVVSVSGDGWVDKWELKTGKTLFHDSIEVGLASVDISPDGRHILVGGRRGLRLLDSKNGKQLARFPNISYSTPFWSCRFLKDGRVAGVNETDLFTYRVLLGQDLIDAARRHLKHMKKTKREGRSVNEKQL